MTEKQPPRVLQALNINPDEISSAPTERLEEMRSLLRGRRHHVYDVRRQIRGVLRDVQNPPEQPNSYPLIDGKNRLDPRIHPQVPPEFDASTKKAIILAHQATAVANLLRVDTYALNEIFLLNGYLGPVSSRLRQARRPQDAQEQAKREALQKLETAQALIR